VLAAAKADARARARGQRPGDRSGSGRAGGSGATGTGTDAGTAGTGGTGGTGGGAAGDGPGPPGGGAESDDRQPPRRPRLPGIAPPGREWRDPASFATAISRLLATRGWQAQATDASVLARWETIVGPDISSHATAVSLRDGELELAAESTAWATQLRLLSRQLLGVLRRELGAGVVTRITVRGPSAPSWRHGSIHTGGRGPRDTYG
jgi:predicted nucleic acid-binding Zn ribbon protein